jgi:hypothetical protein
VPVRNNRDDAEVRRSMAIASVLVVVLGLASSVAVHRVSATRHSCMLMTQELNLWSLDLDVPRPDTTPITRAAERVRTEAARVPDAEVRAAGFTYAAAIRAVATAYAQGPDADPALERDQAAWAFLRVACGMPTQNLED